MWSSTEIAIAWAVFGLALMLMELILPGLVAIFLGAAALVTALLVFLGVVSGWMNILITWFASSLVFLLILRTALSHFLGGDTSRGHDDEEANVAGREVDVLTRITAADSQGEIFYRGAVWKARSQGESIQQGDKARLVRREMLVWIVEPAGRAASPQEPR